MEIPECGYLRVSSLIRALRVTLRSRKIAPGDFFLIVLKHEGNMPFENDGLRWRGCALYSAPINSSASDKFMSDSAPLKRTPLYDLHRRCGGKIVPFAGYEMPVNFGDGILKEHEHTRSAAGLFDVSHMGQVTVAGDAVAEALETLIPADLISLAGRSAEVWITHQRRRRNFG